MHNIHWKIMCASQVVLPLRCKTMQTPQSSQWLCLFALSHSDIFRSWSPHPFSSCQWLLELKCLQLRVMSMRNQHLIPKTGVPHKLVVSKVLQIFLYRFVAPSTTLVYRCFIVPNARHSELCKFGLSCPSKQNWHSPTNLPAATMQNQQSLKATATAITQRPQTIKSCQIVGNANAAPIRHFIGSCSLW